MDNERLAIKIRSAPGFGPARHILDTAFAERDAEIERLQREVIAYAVDHELPGLRWIVENKMSECETCGGTGEVDEMLGGISTSDQHAPCPDCT